MYAIVEIAGKQFRVEEKSRLRVPLLDVESGKKVEFGNVVVYNDDKKLQIGTPLVDKVKVSATVIEHNREKKIIVFKKKRRKGYQVKNGHRQHYSLIQVDKIGAGTVTSKTQAEPTAKKETKTATKPAAKTAPKTVDQKAKSSAAKAAPAKTAEKPKSVAKTKAAPAKKTEKPKTTTKAKTTANTKAAAKTAPAKTAAKPKTATKAKPAAKKAQPKDKKE